MPDQQQTGTVQTRVTENPFPAQAEAFGRIFDRAEEQFGVPRAFFPGSSVVPFAPQTEQALRLQEQRALQGSPLNQAAQNTILSTARGDFLNRENPAFQALADRLSGDISSRVNASFSGGGRFGSLANREATARGIGDALAPIAFQNFSQERQNQLAASQFAPQLAQNDFADIAQLASVGGSREAQANAMLQDQINRFNFQQEEPRRRLAELAALIGGGSLGTQQTTTQPVFTNPTANTLGTAASIAGIGTTLLGSGGLDLLQPAGEAIGGFFA